VLPFSYPSFRRGCPTQSPVPLTLRQFAPGFQKPSGEDYQVALDKLQNDLLAKTDGCAASGAPDKNDWIATCEEQAVVYQELQRIIIMLQELQ